MNILKKPTKRRVTPWGYIGVVVFIIGIIFAAMGTRSGHDLVTVIGLTLAVLGGLIASKFEILNYL